MDRVKPILLDIVEAMDELGQVKIGLCGFTNMARSHVPVISREDYPYLEESIRKIIGVYSVGSSTGLGDQYLIRLPSFRKMPHRKL